MSQTIITAKRPFSLNIKEIISYRELLYMLAYRDIRVRYAQTILGLLWAIIQPLVTLIIFTIIFGRLVKVDTGSIPYPLFALSGMALWSYFSAVMTQSGNSIISAQSIVKKIYFPRLIIPLSKSISAIIDLTITLLFLVAMMLYYGITPSLTFFYAPLCVGAAVISALGVGIWLSALTIRYRDFQAVLPFMVQLGMYATPVAYPSSLIPSQYLGYYYLNPMAGIIDTFRAILFHLPVSGYSAISFVVGGVLFISGLFYFRSVEGEIADIV